MLTSLALVLLLGIIFSFLCKKINLPTIIGMIFAGVILGPYTLDMLDQSILKISSDLRTAALVIILLKGGFALDINDMKKNGRSAVMMSFVPASFEILAFLIFAPIFLGISRLDAAIMGSVLAAVSPAVVIPRMTKIIEEKYGTKKGIPQLVIAGASCDDIFVIVLFSSFVAMADGEKINLYNFLNIPISIILGIILGALVGYFLSFAFEKFHEKNQHVRNSTKIILIIAISFLMLQIEKNLKDIISISGLLAVISMACTMKFKINVEVSERISEKLGKLWIAAEIILFVLVGAEINIVYILNIGFGAIFLILFALAIRSIGVYFCLLGTNLKFREKIFCMISYLPKATVQAAIGSVPLSMGLPCGDIVLSVAVLGIMITALLGSILIDKNYKKLLIKN